MNDRLVSKKFFLALVFTLECVAALVFAFFFSKGMSSDAWEFLRQLFTMQAGFFGIYLVGQSTIDWQGKKGQG